MFRLTPRAAAYPFNKSQSASGASMAIDNPPSEPANTGADTRPVVAFLGLHPCYRFASKLTEGS